MIMGSKTSIMLKPTSRNTTLMKDTKGNSGRRGAHLWPSRNQGAHPLN
jgi:hypothetical protein